MIDLYYWTTPNGHKITIFLEEAGLHFPARCVLAQFGGDPCMRFVSTEENLVLTLLSWVFVSARKIPFPGNGDGVRRELGPIPELIGRKAQHPVLFRPFSGCFRLTFCDRTLQMSDLDDEEQCSRNNGTMFQGVD